MAITINQSPTYPNVAYTNLVYAVSSNLVNNPQYQYVMDVVSGSSVLSRVRQYPNPAGAGIFDPSRIVRDYLEYDTSFDKTGYWYPQDTEKDVQAFTFKFGEEYGTSPSSSIVLYDGDGNVGSPAISSSTDDLIFEGTVDPNNGVSYNWLPTGSAVLLTDRPDGVPLVGDLDYFTISAWNGSGTAENLTVSSKTPAGSTVSSVNLPATDGYFISANIGYNSTNLTVSKGIQVSLDGDTRFWPYDEESCNYDRVNFAFINNYGMWDYYGFNLPIKKNTNIQRKSIVKPFVDYSSTTSAYNGKRRGTQVYNTAYSDDISVSTPLISQEVANWLTQLLESPEVYLQEGTNMIPIEITNSNFTHNTNARSQKAFQYEISYRYANQRQTR